MRNICVTIIFFFVIFFCNSKCCCFFFAVGFNCGTCVTQLVVSTNSTKKPTTTVSLQSIFSGFSLEEAVWGGSAHTPPLLKPVPTSVRNSGKILQWFHTLAYFGCFLYFLDALTRSEHGRMCE